MAKLANWRAVLMSPTDGALTTSGITVRYSPHEKADPAPSQDAGWAGPVEAFGEGDPIVSAGMGASFLDGLIRIDLARALVEPTGWRMKFYLNGAL